MPMPDMYKCLELLQQYKHVAIVGLSADSYRPSHFAAIYLQSEGYDIIPINPRYAGTTLLGKHVYSTLTEAKAAGEQIEIVDIFRRSEDTLPIAQEAIEIGAQVVWLQLGVRNAETGKLVREAGLEFVENRCIKIEHARFFGGLHTVGLNTGVILACRLPVLQHRQTDQWNKESPMPPSLSPDADHSNQTASHTPSTPVTYRAMHVCKLR
jgi:predicted CoA-binding protein